VPAAGSATYQIWFRLPIPNPNLNPNPKTDPNRLTRTLKVTIMYAAQNDTEIKFNIVLYIKVIFVGHGVGIQKRPTPQTQIIKSSSPMMIS